MKPWVPVSRGVCSLGCGLLVWALSTAALGQTPNAQGVYARGLLAFQAQRYSEALIAFEEAWQLSPRPEVLYNIGLVERALGRYQSAIRTWERYLALSNAPRDPSIEQQLHASISTLEAQLAHVTLEVSPPNTEVLFDGRPREAALREIALDPGMHVLECRAEGFEPTRLEIRLSPGERRRVSASLRPQVREGTLQVETSEAQAEIRIDAAVAGLGGLTRSLRPGEHVVEVSAPGRLPARRIVTVVAGQSTHIRVSLGANVRPREREAPRTIPWWTYGAVGGAVALSGSALALGLAAEASERDYLRRCVETGPEAGCSGLQSERQSSLDAMSLGVNVLWVLAIASAATAGVGLEIGLSQRRPARVAAGPRGTFLEIRW